MKKLITLGIAVVLGAACGTPAKSDVVSTNISTAADNFEVNRRIVFFNGVTDTYLMTIEGRCSIEADGLDGQLEVTCLIAEEADDPASYKKHYLGLSDNVSYFVEQVDGSTVSAYHYRVIFRPETIIPDVDLDVEG